MLSKPRIRFYHRLDRAGAHSLRSAAARSAVPDTVVVLRPAKGGNIVIRSRLLDYTGVFMLHCRMMNHDEMSVMQTVEVVTDDRAKDS
jgi:FtsP/CotA-like multicopper oxidase with cupredoxin domain